MVPRNDGIDAFGALVNSEPPVQIGLRQKGRVEIVDGLGAGDVVVTVGTHKVTAGAPIVDVAAGPGEGS